MNLPCSDDRQQIHWNTVFSGNGYYYGFEPGPVARRAVRYHSQKGSHATALDAGCGEGQDLVYLASCGYAALGLDFTAKGVEKSRRLLEAHQLQAEVQQVDLRSFEPGQKFDLVIAVNVLQFLGVEALSVLERLSDSVAKNGVIGLSLFAREGDMPRLHDGVYYTTLIEVMERLNPPHDAPRFAMLETANLWQWNEAGQARPFITIVARRLQ